MGYFIIGCFMVFLFLTLIILLNWITHLEMVNKDCDVYGWGSYKKFKEQFDKIEWECNYYFNSVFVYHRNYHRNKLESKCHANIFKFRNIGMKMRTPLDYYLANRYIKKYIKTQRNCLYKW